MCLKTNAGTLRCSCVSYGGKWGHGRRNGGRFSRSQPNADALATFHVNSASSSGPVPG